MHHPFNGRGMALAGYSIAAGLLLLGIPVISADRVVILGCLLSFPLILLVAAALLRTLRSAEVHKDDLWIVHLVLLLRFAVALIAVRVVLWLAGYSTLSALVEWA